jgi:uncharacterized membrane protein YraQ (UPF0718 family)
MEEKMLNDLLEIANFILGAFWKIWPYLLLTIPLAVAVRLSGASKYISRAFLARPILAIFLATAVGAFSPFCSCSVIPVVATMLIGGVPLAPVIAFWIASPSMDPEIFFLSVPMLGWELAVWRLVATLVLSLSAGLITHVAMLRGWLGPEILCSLQAGPVRSTRPVLREGWQQLKRSLTVWPGLSFAAGPGAPATTTVCCGPARITLVDTRPPPAGSMDRPDSGCGGTSAGSSCAGSPPVSFRRRLFQETWRATVMVAKFMALAFLLEALIILYVPQAWIAGLVGQPNRWAILWAALMGVPVYTTELAALPLVGGLLAQGMNPAAALAFLIAGPTTTLPAMAAVWGLVTRRVFLLYISFSLIGAVVLGYLYNFTR